MTVTGNLADVGKKQPWDLLRNASSCKIVKYQEEIVIILNGVIRYMP